MDKALQKQLFERAGLKVARHLTVLNHEWRAGGNEVARGIDGVVGYPAFVKPANGGSSVGVTKVRSREDLGDALKAAFALDRKALVEETLHGHEVECGVLGNDEPQASPVGEVIPAGEFYDYSAKYLDDSARLVAPAELLDETAAAVRDAAVRAFRAIDGRGYARVDFFVTDRDEPVVNEINTVPGFTPISMFPRLWGLAGVTYRELIARIVDLALDVFRERQHDGR